MSDNSESSGGTELIQLIKDDLSFNQDLKNVLEKWDVINLNLDYHVVAILGCQSSGKSTLLNLLFDTKFQVMDADCGRSQTTIGIWLGRSDKKDTLVLDVEGTDSRERGEEATNFERKMALFSLALAEVLIVNLWHNDIGRYNAANYSLLKNVFELNLQLFGRSRKGKTLILFVIRDHGVTPLDKLEALLYEDMRKIWSQLQKPSELSDAAISDFFDFTFKALPHKEFKPDEFYVEVANLKKRFSDPSQPDYLWTSSYTTDVPADGWPAYSENIWETIKANKDLDLPSQKEMLAIYRCGELADQAYKTFETSIEPYKKQLKKESIPNFGEIGSELLETTITQYNTLASRYVKEIANDKREKLKERILQTLREAFNDQVLRLREVGFQKFQAQLEHEFPPEAKKSSPNFAEVVDRLETAVLEEFEERIKVSLVEPTWEYDSHIQSLRDTITFDINAAKKRQVTLVLKEMKETIQRSFASVGKILESGEPDSWSKIRNLYEDAKTNATAFLKKTLPNFKLQESDVEKYISQLNDQVFEAFKEVMKDLVRDISRILEKKFEENFSRDSQGLVRRWGPSDDINQIFLAAKTKALRLLDVFAIMRLDSKYDSLTIADLNDPKCEIDSELIVINFNESEKIKDAFTRQTDVHYDKAVTAQEHAAAQKNTPVFLILLILLLGFNEFMYVASTIFFNPFLLVFVVLIGGSIYIAYALGFLSLLAPLKGPAVEMIKSGSLAAFQAGLSKLQGAAAPKAKSD